MNIIEQFIPISSQIISEYYQSREPQNLYEPIDYVLNIGGKRLRPALCMAACHFFNGNGMVAGSAAIGLEIFHNFTLLHDDIMDGAAMRRNQPTVHVKWNPNTAILSGDAMMIIANQLMLNVPDYSLKAVQNLFLQTALEVCEGQQYDMDFEKKDWVEVDEYLNMIRLKTAVLIAASLKIGALIGGADELNANLIYEFGINIGLAFQLQDDYLDVYGDSDQFGKSIGGDIVCNKKTFLLINCLKKADESQRQQLQKWLVVEQFDREEKILAITKLYNDLKIPELSRLKMEEYFQKSLQLIEEMSIGDECKESLKVFASQTLLRTK